MNRISHFSNGKASDSNPVNMARLSFTELKPLLYPILHLFRLKRNAANAFKIADLVCTINITFRQDNLFALYFLSLLTSTVNLTSS